MLYLQNQIQRPGNCHLVLVGKEIWGRYLSEKLIKHLTGAAKTLLFSAIPTHIQRSASL